MTRIRFTSIAFAFWKGRDAMCLAIPGKIVEFADGQNEVGIVEVAGVRQPLGDLPLRQAPVRLEQQKRRQQAVSLHADLSCV